MRNVLLLISIAGLPLTNFAQHAPPPQPPGAYYSAQMPYLPPLPFNPFPLADIVEVEPQRFVYDDTQVDYVSLRTWQHGGGGMMMSMSGPPVPGPGGGGGTNPPPPYIAPTVPIPGVPLLTIGKDPEEDGEGEDVFYATFATKTNYLYRLERTASLSNPVWEVVEQFVATETNEIAVIDQDGFYRVWQDSPMIQWPDWFDMVYQYMEFTCYTPITNGTRVAKLYADGVQIYGSTNTLNATNGILRVFDPNYDPAFWPYTGYYEDVSEWTFDVTVTRSGPSQQNLPGDSQTHRVLKKPGMQRNPQFTYYGMLATIDMWPNNATVRDEVDFAHYFIMSALYNACEIVDWNFNPIDPLTLDQSYMFPNTYLFGPPSTTWPTLHTWLTRNTPSNTASQVYLDYFHYCGHGSSKSFGWGAANQQITKQHFEDSPSRPII